MRHLTDGERDIIREQERDARESETGWADADPTDLEGCPVATLDWWHVGWADAFQGKQSTPPADPDAAREYQAGYREGETWVRVRREPDTAPLTVIQTNDDYPF